MFFFTFARWHSLRISFTTKQSNQTKVALRDFTTPLWQRGVRGDFWIKYFYYKIPLHPPRKRAYSAFTKREYIFPVSFLAWNLLKGTIKTSGMKTLRSKSHSLVDRHSDLFGIIRQSVCHPPTQIGGAWNSGSRLFRNLSPLCQFSLDTRNCVYPSITNISQLFRKSRILIL